MTTSEKVAYLKGLSEGMGIGEDSKEGKLFKVITDILEDLSLDMEDTRDAVEELMDAIDEIGENLTDLEEEFYECACDCGDCSCCDEDEDDDDEEDEDEDEDEEEDEEPAFYSVECESCGFRVTVDEDILAAGEFECPECGGTIDFRKATVEMVDFNEDEDDD